MEKKDFLKLTEVTYLLLDFFPESDPLKKKTREKILDLTENLFLFWEEKMNYSLAEKIKIDIETFLEYLKIAKKEGWLSTWNYLILLYYYQEIKGEVEKWLRKSSLQRENFCEKIFGENNKRENLQTKNSFLFNKRQEKIIDFLKNHQKAAVRDFQNILGKVSKRTIRRDLEDLLKLKIVKREGEFNKIFYSLVEKNGTGVGTEKDR